MANVAEVLSRYVAFVSAGDIDGSVSLYAPDVTIEIPVGGPVHHGIDAIRAFYRDNELAQKLEITGPSYIAGHEGAVNMQARIAQDGKPMELDGIDVASVDAQGRLTRLRAFFDLAGARPVTRAPGGC